MLNSGIFSGTFNAFHKESPGEALSAEPKIERMAAKTPRIPSPANAYCKPLPFSGLKNGDF
jgi:hypothetical protein